MVFMVMREDGSRKKKAKKAKKRCGFCRRWHYHALVGNVRSGECEGAIELARKVVPFAVNLSVGWVYEHGGRGCPCYEPK